MSLLLGSCSSEDILTMPNGNGRIRFDVGVSQSQEVVVTPMNGGATRSAEPLFLPTSSIEMHSGDMTMYANCASTADIPMHNIIPETTTRGSIQTADNFYSEFGIFGYFYDSTQSWASIKSSISPNSSMDNLNVTQTSKSWTTNVYWPGGTKKATFFAYAPYNSSATLTSDTGAPKITYTVPSDIAQQRDLLVAKSIENISCDGNSTVALDFKHALSAIKFVKGDTPGYKEIKGIQISGVYNQGTLNMNSQSWENTSGSDTYSISTIDENTVCFLMPQSVPSGAKLSVTLTNGGTEHTFEAGLDGTLWQAGHQYTYSLSINKITGKFIFEVTSPTKPVPAEGGEATFNVKSYFEYDGTSEQKAVKFNVESNGDTNCSIGGTDTDISRTVTLSFSANNETSSQDVTLKATPEVGTVDNPVDLSIRTKDGTQVRETANCYVVNAPGWYMFPLVYGNGIKSNSTSFDYNLTGFQGAVFTTHEDTKTMSSLASPWINESYDVSSCELLWQDAENLIEYDSYQIFEVNSKKYMRFHISSLNIKQGNAVLAVKNSSQILWSWHIWVTALDVYSTQAVTSSFGGTLHTLNFMPVPLGWYSASETVNPKTYTLSVVQEGSGKTTNGIVTQAGQTGPASGTCTFYQWGRKDPFPPSNGSSLTSKTEKTLYAYSTSGTSITVSLSTASEKVPIATSILNPSTSYGSNSNWCSQESYELWNVGEDDYYVDFEPITKSVYDPSPAGFRLPETAAFTGFTKNGANDGTRNGTWNNSTKGYTFTNGVETYWQACGFRASNSGSLNYVGSDGYYWSAGPSDTKGGRYLSFNSSYVNPQSNFYRRAYGLSVRPVLE